MPSPSRTDAPAKPATPDHPIHELLVRRWSPRAFAERPVEAAKLRRLFEAARWAASSFNEQPWRFFLATRDDPARFEQAVSCLVEGNQAWARHAPVLILTAIHTRFTRNDKPNRVALHDLGLAMGSLTLQATAMDLHVHQMAGVKLDRVREVYALPEAFEPQTAAAVGYGTSDLSRLPANLHDAERGPRERLPLAEFVYSESFGQPAPEVRK
ncbi:MAG: nitroreductase family protein [Phycisphaeraceae bacterium]